MPSTYQQLLYHIVFTTKNRKPYLANENHRGKVFAYMAGIAKKLEGFALAIGGWVDHAHLLVRFPARIAVATVLSAVAVVPAQGVVTADVDNSQPLNRGLLGQVIEVPLTTSALVPGRGQNHDAQVATMMRGVMGGLRAEYYDWRDPHGVDDPDRNFDPNQGGHRNTLSTLDYLRLSRDVGAATILNVNTRGTFKNRFAWGTESGGGANPFVLKSATELAEWAAAWVQYVNHTVHAFDQSNLPSVGTTDRAIYDSLEWHNADGGNPRDKLPAAGETGLGRVDYWQIGNEPIVGLFGMPAVLPADFALRYKTITTAMIARDRLLNGGSRTIKVGPVLLVAWEPSDQSLKDYIREIQNVAGTLDFVGYNAYDYIFGGWNSSNSTNWQTPSTPDDPDWNTVGYAGLPDTPLNFVRDRISVIFPGQKAVVDEVKDVVGAGAVDSNQVELVVGEWNPSSWQGSFWLRHQGMSMAQSLGAMETVFAFARLGVDKASYFTRPSFNNDTDSALYQTLEFMKENLGDQLLGMDDGRDPDSTHWRGYITRDSSTGQIILWALNWSDQDVAITFQVDDLGQEGPYQKTAFALVGNEGIPNVDPLLTGYPEAPVEIVSTPVGQEVLDRIQTANVSIPASSWKAIVFRPVPEPATTALLGVGALVFLTINPFRALCSGRPPCRYQSERSGLPVGWCAEPSRPRATGRRRASVRSTQASLRTCREPVRRRS